MSVLSKGNTHFPAEWAAYAARRTDFRFPGGETGLEAQERIVAFAEDTRHRHGGGNILAVSHDGLIRLLMCYVVGLPVYRWADFQVDPCGLMELDYQAEYGRWKLVRFNQSLAPGRDWPVHSALAAQGE